MCAIGEYTYVKHFSIIRSSWNLASFPMPGAFPKTRKRGCVAAVRMRMYEYKRSIFLAVLHSNMSANEGHGTGGQVQARDWRPRTSAVFESEDGFPDVQNGAHLQKPVPQPRQVRRMDQMPQQQPIPVVQLAPATQRPAPDATMYAPPPGPAVQQPVQPTPVLQHMPPPYSITHGAGIQPQWHATHPVQPQSAAAPAVVKEKAANKKTGIYKMKWKVNSRFCTMWRGVLEIIARSGAIVSL